MAFRLASVPISAVLLLGLSGAANAKTDVLRTQAGRTVRWVHRDISIGFDAGNPSRTVSPEGARDALRAAVDVWNGVPELPLRFVLTNASEPAVRVRFCHTVWRGEPDNLARAVFTADVETGEVASAEVEINECERAFLPPDQAQDGRFDLQAVLTHELGHVLGLGHSDDPEALMYSRGGTAGVRTPKLEDRAAVAVVYDTALVTQPPRTQQFASALMPPEPTTRQPSQLDKLLSDEVLSAMRIADDRGRSLVVFTCEPTLLPPISSLANEDGPKPNKGRARRARAAHALSRP